VRSRSQVIVVGWSSWKQCVGDVNAYVRKSTKQTKSETKVRPTLRACGQVLLKTGRPIFYEQYLFTSNVLFVLYIPSFCDLVFAVFYHAGNFLFSLQSSMGTDISPCGFWHKRGFHPNTKHATHSTNWRNFWISDFTQFTNLRIYASPTELSSIQLDSSFKV